MLEVRTGEPWWYRYLVVAALLLFSVALLIEPIETEFVLMLLVSAAIVFWLDLRKRHKNSRFTAIGVSKDFSITLINREGLETLAEGPFRCWITRQLIVIKVGTESNKSIHLAIAKSLNHPETFRRFSVICRFGFDVEDSDRHNVAQLNPEEA